MIFGDFLGGGDEEKELYYRAHPSIYKTNGEEKSVKEFQLKRKQNLEDNFINT